MGIYILETTNTWHDYNSIKHIAICSSLDSAINLAKSDAMSNDEPLTEVELEQLEEYMQTEGRDTNYSISFAVLDQLL